MEHEKKIGGMNMRKVALSLMLAASMAATTLGSTAVFASDATTTESESYTYRYALADFPTNWSLHDNQTQTDSVITCYDRMIIQGYIPNWSHAEAMTAYMKLNGIRIFDYPTSFSQPLRQVPLFLHISLIIVLDFPQ